ncbi:hypothetical protein Tco_0747356 [Tanacetum coccineum]|uniref:Uncharacterized protein n=1 Tax=Tanacetum coccineum TaxID=301880 RepID=A0ABQ4YUZ8_9ASTR
MTSRLYLLLTCSSAGEDTEAFEIDDSLHPHLILPQIRIPLCPDTSPYRAAGFGIKSVGELSPPLALLLLSPRTDRPEADDASMDKRACLTTPAPGYEIGESSAAGAARQPGHTPALDTWDEIVEAWMELSTDHLWKGLIRTEECEVRFEEARDDRAYLGALVNTLYRERIRHRRTALAIDREAVYARIAWTSSEERSAAIEAHTQLTTALGRIATLEARDPEPQDGPAEAGSSTIMKMLPTRRATRTTPATTTAPTTTVTEAQLQALIDQGVAAALAERDASRSSR